MPPLGAFAALAIAVLTAAPGCRPDLPDPPDPGEPTPTVGCEENGPVTLTRTAADSTLVAPAWVEVCTLCPSDSFDVSFADAEGTALDSVTAWARGTGCAVAMTTAPVPADGLDVTYRVTAGERSGDVTLDVPVSAEERGPDPEGLDGATFTLEWPFARSRHPHEGNPLLVDPADGPSLLVSFGAPDGDGLRPVTAGVTVTGGGEQDLCEPTHAWGAARLDTRQLGARLDAGASIPQPTPIPVLEGALQGRLNETGEGLFDVALIGVIDLAALEPALGPVADVCADLVDLDGVSACAPCTAPADGADESQRCITAVWEWAAAARADEPLQPVDADALPPDCNREH